MSYFDDYGMPNPNYGEVSTNGILFLVEYILLLKLLGKPIEKHLKDFHFVVEVMEVDGRYAQTPWVTPAQDEASHDNMTAIASLSYLEGFDFHKNIPSFTYMHPRDVIYYGLLQRKWWAKFLEPIHSIITIHTCWRNYEAPNGLPDTDGKLLAWVKFRSYKMPLTEKICNYFVGKQFGGWKKVFETYFREPTNPVRMLAQEAL